MIYSFLSHYYFIKPISIRYSFWNVLTYQDYCFWFYKLWYCIFLLYWTWYLLNGITETCFHFCLNSNITYTVTRIVYLDFYSELYDFHLVIELTNSQSNYNCCRFFVLLRFLLQIYLMFVYFWKLAIHLLIRFQIYLFIHLVDHLHLRMCHFGFSCHSSTVTVFSTLTFFQRQIDGWRPYSFLGIIFTIWRIDRLCCSLVLVRIGIRHLDFCRQA